MNSRHSSTPPYRLRDQTIHTSRSARTRLRHPEPSIVDHLNTPDIILTGVLLLAGILYSCSHIPFRVGHYHFTIRQLAWDIVVFCIPGFLIQIADSWLKPILNDKPMTLTLSHAAKSDALARIFGMDQPGGLMASVSQARRRLSSVSSPFMKEKEPTKPPGLGNWDNSCYQNSVLQGLSALTPLPEYLAGPEHGLNMPVDSTTFNLLTLIADLNSGENNGRTLWTPSILKSMSSRIQQDAQEYFSKVLDEVDKEIIKAIDQSKEYLGYKRRGADDAEVDDRAKARAKITDGSDIRETTCFRNPLEGLVAQRVACMQCGYSEGLSMTPFICLTLNLDTNTSVCDLYQRLDAFTTIESIEGVYCAKCTLLKNKEIMSTLIKRLRVGGVSEGNLKGHIERLAAVETALEEDDFEDGTLKEKCQMASQNKVSSTKTKQMVIARPPRSLVVHINRSVFDERTFMFAKNPAPVRFPVDLDLGPWCLGSAPDPSDRSTEDEEHWVTQADASMAAGEVLPSKISGPMYELRAVVIHQGRHDNGHYICYRKHSGINKLGAFEESRMYEKDPGNQSIELENLSKQDIYSQQDWWRLSDDTVYKCTEEEVLGQGGAFMLFYDCVDKTPIRTANNDLEKLGLGLKRCVEGGGMFVDASEDVNEGSDTSPEMSASKDSPTESSPEPPESEVSV